MCGISGEMWFEPHAWNEQWVRQSCNIMKHRGPDGHGYYSAEKIAFGHRRLSIIDLNTGAQPMHYMERYTITYNGEIYNYLQLKQDLIAEGMPFTTQSDTEVILAGYAYWGRDFVKKLNGIFAFAIWDKQEQSLFLARDHLGVKPLLYHCDEQGIRFASELKALLLHPSIDSEVDSHALSDYLAMGYVLSPKTIIKDVHKLPAGHYLYMKEKQAVVESYWSLAETTNMQPFTYSEAELIDQFTTIFERSIHQQMISDVPVGAFLSGGIDSSTICTFANQHTPHALKTFSAGFDEASYNELDYAQTVANFIDTDHQQDIIPPQSIESLSELVWKYDEPLGDTSLIATYFVSQLARGEVTVVLSGDGGDELLAGYDTYLADKFQGVYRRIPSALHHNVVQPLVNFIPSSYKKVSWDFKIKQFISQAYQSPQQAHYGWRLMFHDEAIIQIMGTQTGYRSFDQYASHYQNVKSASALNQSLYVDIKTWLVDDILSKVDRATMACSLEARVPFLSRDVVEFSMRLPDKLKLNGLQRKYILKQVMQSRLPKEITHRKKRGFNTPIGNWMRDSLSSEVDTLLSQSSSLIIDTNAPIIQALWKEHKTGRVDHTFKLWTIVSLLLWEKSVLNS